MQNYQASNNTQHLHLNQICIRRLQSKVSYFHNDIGKTFSQLPLKQNNILPQNDDAISIFENESIILSISRPNFFINPPYKRLIENKKYTREC